MPAAPAAQPRPQIGIRRVCSERPRRKISFASRDGVETPVVETKKIAPTFSGSTPALSHAVGRQSGRDRKDSGAVLAQRVVGPASCATPGSGCSQVLRKTYWEM